MKYSPKHNRNELLTSLKTAVKSNLEMSDVILKHKRILLDRALWAITEVDGKYNLRFVTDGARNCESRKELRHEHVYPRKFIIDTLISDPKNYSQTIDTYAIACIVTQSEHTLLDDSIDGWKRYERAGLKVIELEESNYKNTKLNSEKMENENTIFWSEFSQYCSDKGKSYLQGKVNPPNKPYNEQQIGAIPKTRIQFSYRLKPNGKVIIEIYMNEGMNSGVYSSMLKLKPQLEAEFGDLEFKPSANHAKVNLFSKLTFDRKSPSERKNAMSWLLENGEKMYNFLNSNGTSL